MWQVSGVIFLRQCCMLFRAKPQYHDTLSFNPCVWRCLQGVDYSNMLMLADYAYDVPLTYQEALGSVGGYTLVRPRTRQPTAAAAVGGSGQQQQQPQAAGGRNCRQQQAAGGSSSRQHQQAACSV